MVPQKILDELNIYRMQWAMQHTEMLETERKDEELFKNFELAAFIKKAFGMYGGVDEKVTLECNNKLP